MATCLTQAVAAQLLLVRSGHASEICVGVARDSPGAFRAHAWVELKGRVILGGEGVTAFSRFPSLGSGLGRVGGHRVSLDGRVARRVGGTALGERRVRTREARGGVLEKAIRRIDEALRAQFGQ